ncbi:MAG: 3-dehydroquinate synthase, partial [Planctomycetes bacterium]|nr:3-dehydroquinate synthase [Planctomycetota bacterium]
MRRLEVVAGAHRHAVIIGDGVLALLGRHLVEAGLGGPAALVTDEHLADSHAETARDSMARSGIRVAVVVLAAGEEGKTLEAVSGLYRRFAEAGLERTSPVVAVGGGVV